MRSAIFRGPGWSGSSWQLAHLLEGFRPALCPPRQESGVELGRIRARQVMYAFRRRSRLPALAFAIATCRPRCCEVPVRQLSRPSARYSQARLSSVHSCSARFGTMPIFRTKSEPAVPVDQGLAEAWVVVQRLIGTHGDRQHHRVEVGAGFRHHVVDWRFAAPIAFKNAHNIALSALPSFSCFGSRFRPPARHAVLLEGRATSPRGRRPGGRCG